MKKIVLSALLVAAMGTFTSCGTTGSGSLLGTAAGNTSTTSGASTSGSLLSGILGNLLGSSSTLSQSDLVGTWNYKGSDCAFESENLLAQAGGKVAALKIESELDAALAKVGIEEGSCSFVFNKDNTYTINLGSHTINGNYTLNASEKTLTMTYLAGMGTMTPKIVKSGSTISLLFESDKLLTLASTLSALSSSTSAKTLSTLLKQYDGLYVGMKLSK